MKNHERRSFQGAVDDLSASISAAEKTAGDATDAVAAYTDQLNRTGSPDKDGLLLRAQHGISDVGTATDAAKKFIPRAEEAQRRGGDVPEGILQEVQKATSSVKNADNNLKATLTKVNAERKRLAGLPGKANSSSGGATSSSSASPACTPPVPDAYPCAGQKSVPAGAKDLPVYQNSDLGAQAAAFQSASGSMQCYIWSGDDRTNVECSNRNWTPDTARLPSGQKFYGTLGADLTKDGDARWAEANSGSIWDQATRVSLAHDTIWKHGDWVVASSANGFTIWTVKTGHGALINKTGLYPF